jgi:hypothetical protein
MSPPPELNVSRRVDTSGELVQESAPAGQVPHKPLRGPRDSIHSSSPNMTMTPHPLLPWGVQPTASPISQLPPRALVAHRLEHFHEHGLGDRAGVLGCGISVARWQISEVHEGNFRSHR